MSIFFSLSLKKKLLARSLALSAAVKELPVFIFGGGFCRCLLPDYTTIHAMEFEANYRTFCQESI